MLPSPAELRELAERIRAAVSHAPTDEMKQSLAAYAFRLAQVAEQLERADITIDTLVRRANIDRYQRLLAGALDERTRRTVEALLGQENTARDNERRQIEAWRTRAEELRAAADNLPAPSVHESLRRAAQNLDSMADHTEALLTGDPTAPGEQAG
ncbi:MAG TPA: hypothetical protein VGU20_06645 [Stellaceae bacterium]|nr:hypothetical protein [Stellaceae bacterium]